jgi:hypothetical protein
MAERRALDIFKEKYDEFVKTCHQTPELCIMSFNLCKEIKEEPMLEKTVEDPPIPNLFATAARLMGVSIYVDPKLEGDQIRFLSSFSALKSKK